jgi:hypothetical protein
MDENKDQVKEFAQALTNAINKRKGKCPYLINLLPEVKDLEEDEPLFNKSVLSNLPLPIPAISRNLSLKFNSADEAALNWILLNNEESKKRNKEAASYIYRDSNNLFYTQKLTNWFEIDGFTIPKLNKAAAQENIHDSIVGIVHTHGNTDSNYDSEYFSDIYNDSTNTYEGDIPLADEFNIPLYLGTPNDTFRKYQPKIGQDKFYFGNLK